MSWQIPAIDEVTLKSIRPLAVIGLLVVLMQIALGGWTTSNYADIACPDFPTCQGEWLPPMNFGEGFNITQHIGPNYLGGTMDNAARVAIHFSHRLGAIVTVAYLAFLCLKLYRLKLPAAKTLAHVILTVLAVQVTLGISNIVFQFPINVAVAHNLVGALLLLTQVTTIYLIFTAAVNRGGIRV
jgi:cytochrome c oxidase assembly protein subunit 15